jgi:hypothetical protein
MFWMGTTSKEDVEAEVRVVSQKDDGAGRRHGGVDSAGEGDG